MVSPFENHIFEIKVKRILTPKGQEDEQVYTVNQNILKVMQLLKSQYPRIFLRVYLPFMLSQKPAIN